MKKKYLQDVFEGGVDVGEIPSPSYVLCYDSLLWNLRTLKDVSDKSGAKILIALKGYSFWREFAPVREFLSGATCSGLHETLLAYEEITLKHLKDSNENTKSTNLDSKKLENMESNGEYKEICVFSPAYKKEQMQEIVKYATHIIFNSFGQWEKFKGLIEARNAEIRAFWRDKDSKNIESKNADSKDYKNNAESKNTESTNLDSKKLENIESNITQNSQNNFPLDSMSHPVPPTENLKENYPANFDNQDFIESIQPQEIQVGLRVNPLYSEVSPPIYNPCIPKSRLGITPKEFKKGLRKLAKKYGFNDKKEFFAKHFSGLHFHTHCEQDSAALKRTLPHFTKHFRAYIKRSKWINFGGGHHITRADYDISLLIKLVRKFRQKYNVEVFLEPGEAVGWECGDLVGEVVDIVQNSGNIAVLDISASAHMPDCLEMPYRPHCYKMSFCADTKKWHLEHDLGKNKGKFRYRFGGPTCLAGDVIGDYSFETPLRVGDKVAFVDMMHYTIVKNTTFNGVELPSLCVIKDKKLEILKQFSYKDFKDRN